MKALPQPVLCSTVVFKIHEIKKNVMTLKVSDFARFLSHRLFVISTKPFISFFLSLLGKVLLPDKWPNISYSHRPLFSSLMKYLEGSFSLRLLS